MSFSLSSSVEVWVELWTYWGLTIATCFFDDVSSKLPFTVSSFWRSSSVSFFAINSLSLLQMKSGELLSFRSLEINGEFESRKDPCKLCAPSKSVRCWVALDCRRLSQRMLRLSDAPMLVMQDIEGCFESLKYLGPFRGRQNKGGGKSLRSTLRRCMALSVAPWGIVFKFSFQAISFELTYLSASRWKPLLFPSCKPSHAFQWRSLQVYLVSACTRTKCESSTPLHTTPFAMLCSLWNLIIK